MFFVKGDFLLIPSGIVNGPDEVLNSTLSNSRKRRLVIIPFLSYREAQLFVFDYARSLGLKIKKRKKYPRFEEFNVGDYTQDYTLNILEVNPVSAKEWQKTISATIKFINNGYRWL